MVRVDERLNDFLARATDDLNLHGTALELAANPRARFPLFVMQHPYGYYAGDWESIDGHIDAGSEWHAETAPPVHVAEMFGAALKFADRRGHIYEETAEYDTGGFAWQFRAVDPGNRLADVVAIAVVPQVDAALAPAVKLIGEFARTG